MLLNLIISLVPHNDGDVQIKTTLATNVQKVLGIFPEVVNLDVARRRLKDCPSTDITSITIKLNLHEHKQKKAVHEWKVSHIRKTGSEPWEDELKKAPEVHKKSLQIASQLLNWKITVHL